MALLLVAVISTVLATAPSPASAERTALLPERARVDSFTQSLGVHVARLEISAIGVDEVVRQGVDLSVIDRGVAHWSGTAGPGASGNMVLAGHRTVKTAPFYDLDQLVPGDMVTITGMDGRVADYEVTETIIVKPEDMWITDQTTEPTLTMFACHPKGSATHRIVVRADLAAQPVS
ncbi:MAG: class E sortase, partial [Acidimicrobiia bacterium]|nr:class E sortase [Acidimicrobiia bacterium]